MKLKSKVDACFHPGTGTEIPAAGKQFETDDAIGAALVAAGLATGGEKAAATKQEVKDDGAR